MCGRGPAWRQKFDSCLKIQKMLFKTKNWIRSPRERAQMGKQRKPSPDAPQDVEDRGGEEPAQETGYSHWRRSRKQQHGKDRTGPTISEELKSNITTWKWPINTGWPHAAAWPQTPSQPVTPTQGETQHITSRILSSLHCRSATRAPPAPLHSHSPFPEPGPPSSTHPPALLRDTSKPRTPDGPQPSQKPFHPGTNSRRPGQQNAAVITINC